MPVKAGIQKFLKALDSRLRGNDAKGSIKTFCAIIKFSNKYLDEPANIHYQHYKGSGAIQI